MNYCGFEFLKTLLVSEKKNERIYPKYRNTFDVMVDIETLIKLAPASVATAFASIVLPVPGGPNSSTPLQGWEKPGVL